jgi:hypothetical protein
VNEPFAFSFEEQLFEGAWGVRRLSSKRPAIAKQEGQGACLNYCVFLNGPWSDAGGVRMCA